MTYGKNMSGKNYLLWWLIPFLIGCSSALFGAEEESDSEEERRLENIEFRAFLTLRNALIFSLYDPSLDRSIWLPMEGSWEGLKVFAFDSETDQLTVISGDLKRVLHLGSARVVAGKEDPVECPGKAEDNSPKPRTGTDRERLIDLLNEAREKSDRFASLAEQKVFALRDFRALGREFGDLPMDDPSNDLLYDLRVQVGREMEEILNLLRDDMTRMIDEGIVANVSDRDRMLFRGHVGSLLSAEENERERLTAEQSAGLPSSD